jgi:hypothetical protein
MGLQKFRADESGEAYPNGAVPHYTRWMGGPTLALVRNCPIVGVDNVSPRTVYVRDHADTYFSVPAACKIKGKTIRGSLCYQDDNLVFKAKLT